MSCLLHQQSLQPILSQSTEINALSDDNLLSYHQLAINHPASIVYLLQKKFPVLPGELDKMVYRPPNAVLSGVGAATNATAVDAVAKWYYDNHRLDYTETDLAILAQGQLHSQNSFHINSFVWEKIINYQTEHQISSALALWLSSAPPVHGQNNYLDALYSFFKRGKINFNQPLTNSSYDLGLLYGVFFDYLVNQKKFFDLSDTLQQLVKSTISNSQPNCAQSLCLAEFVLVQNFPSNLSVYWRQQMRTKALDLTVENLPQHWSNWSIYKRYWQNINTNLLKITTDRFFKKKHEQQVDIYRNIKKRKLWQESQNSGSFELRFFSLFNKRMALEIFNSLTKQEQTELLNQKDKNGNSLWHVEASATPLTGIFHSLPELWAYAQTPAARNKNGETPLHPWVAALFKQHYNTGYGYHWGHFHEIEDEHGINFQEPLKQLYDQQGDTPFHTMVKILLDTTPESGIYLFPVESGYRRREIKVLDYSHSGQKDFSKRDLEKMSEANHDFIQFLGRLVDCYQAQTGETPLFTLIREFKKKNGFNLQRKETKILLAEIKPFLYVNQDRNGRYAGDLLLELLPKLPEAYQQALIDIRTEVTSAAVKVSEKPT